MTETRSDQAITPLNAAQTAHQEQQTAAEGYLKRDAVAVDEVVDVFLDGPPDETISSRMARWSTNESGLKGHIGRTVSAALDLLQKDHGAKAEAGDAERGLAVAKLEESQGSISQ